MYLNDIHIAYYILFILIGAIIGQFTDWIIKRAPEEKKIFSKDFFIEYKNRFRPNYILITITILTYLVLLSVHGISENFYGNLNLILYMIITPILIAIFIIDYKMQIIPNRLNLSLFEIGLCYTFILGFNYLNIATDRVIGLVIGGGIFLLITLIGGLIAGKEAMGFGDVKLMCGLGLIFGALGIISVSAMSFLIGAIVSIILLATKIKKTNEYIPFGPFIVISSFIAMIVPMTTIMKVLLTIFTLGMI